MDFFQRTYNKSRKQKVRNGTIKVTMDTRNNIFEVTEENGYDSFDTKRDCQEVENQVKNIEKETEGRERREGPKKDGRLG